MNSEPPRSRSIRTFFESISPTFGKTVHQYAADRRGQALAAASEGRILEIGCGSGAVTRHLVQKGEVLAGDIAFGMAACTREAVGVPTVVFDGSSFPCRSESLDTVVASEAIYYLDNPLSLLRESHRVLRRGGVIALSCMATFWQRVDWVRVKLGIRWGSAVPPLEGTLPVRSVTAELDRLGFSKRHIRYLMPIPFESAHWLNTGLEKTTLGRLGLFQVIVYQK